MLFLLIDFPQKLTFGKTHRILITFFYVSFFLSSATKGLPSSLKNKIITLKKSDCWECIKSHMKKNARAFPKNFTTRAFSSSLLRAIITRNHLPFFKIFSNFEHFCPDFQIFCPFFLLFNIFAPFLKNHAYALTF